MRHLSLFLSLISHSTEQDPRTRPARLSHSHALLLRSVETFPTPSGYYHLALSLARPGPAQDLNQATINVGLALEGDPTEIRYWHLLGLLLTASEQWKEAREALEEGADIGEHGLGGKGEHGDQDQDARSESLETSTVTSNGTDDVHVRDFGAATTNGDGGNGHAVGGLPNGDVEHSALKNDRTPEQSRPPLVLTDKDASAIPPAATLLRPLGDHPAPSRQGVFEHALQLRMTQVALAEYVDGAEGAEERWVHVFGWIAEKKGAVVEQRESDPARVSLGGTQ